MTDLSSFQKSRLVMFRMGCGFVLVFSLIILYVLVRSGEFLNPFFFLLILFALLSLVGLVKSLSMAAKVPKEEFPSLRKKWFAKHGKKFALIFFASIIIPFALFQLQLISVGFAYQVYFLCLGLSFITIGVVGKKEKTIQALSRRYEMYTGERAVREAKYYFFLGAGLILFFFIFPLLLNVIAVLLL